jgi:uncharacterized protein (DUF1330 family)
MAIDPKGADPKRLLSEDPGGRVVMLNLLQFDADGAASYDEYSRRIRPFLEHVGGGILYIGRGSTVLVAEAGQSWDAVLIVRYPNRKAFSQMVASPEYQKIMHLRTQALTEAVLQVTTPSRA